MSSSTLDRIRYREKHYPARVHAPNESASKRKKRKQALEKVDIDKYRSKSPW